jgi:DNA-binding CsgD family transcriptional regulator
VLVLNQDRRILYLNRVAKKFLKNSTGKQERGKSAKELSIHEIIFDLVLEFKRASQEDSGAAAGVPNSRVFLHQKKPYQVGLIPLASDPLAGRDLYHLILIEKVVGNFPIDPSNQATQFTAREKMLVTLLSEGKTNKDLARSMGISEYTVKEHIRRIMRKLNVTTRSGIVAKLLTAGGRS